MFMFIHVDCECVYQAQPLRSVPFMFPAEQQSLTSIFNTQGLLGLRKWTVGEIDKELVKGSRS